MIVSLSSIALAEPAIATAAATSESSSPTNALPSLPSTLIVSLSSIAPAEPAIAAAAASESSSPINVLPSSPLMLIVSLSSIVPAELAIAAAAVSESSSPTNVLPSSPLMLMVSLSSIVPALAISSTLPATNPSEPSIISCTSGLLACAYIVEPSSGSVIEAKRPDSGASLERVKLPISSPFGPESGNIVASPLLTDLPFPAEISLELFFNALAAGAHIEFSPIAGELPPPIVVPPTPFALLPPAPEPTAFEFLPEPLLTLFVLLLLPPLPLIAATAPATVPARPPAFPDNPLAIEPAFLKSIAKPSPACNVVNPRVCKCLSIAVPSLHQETIIITLKQREFALFNVPLPLKGEV